LAYAAGINRITNNNQNPVGAMDQRSDANSGVGSERPANSAMANSDMQDGPGKLDGDSDGSYAKL